LRARSSAACTVGASPTDRLELDDSSVAAVNGIVDPLMPADRAVGSDEFVLVDSDPRILDQRLDVPARHLSSTLRDEVEERAVDQLLPLPAEVAAVCLVDERQRGIRQVAADEVGLRVHDLAVSLL